METSLGTIGSITRALSALNVADVVVQEADCNVHVYLHSNPDSDGIGPEAWAAIQDRRPAGIGARLWIDGREWSPPEPARAPQKTARTPLVKRVRTAVANKVWDLAAWIAS